MAGVNGHTLPGMRLTESAREQNLTRIESALAQMATALASIGFSEFEAGAVNMATRFAISEMIKEQGRKTAL